MYDANTACAERTRTVVTRAYFSSNARVGSSCPVFSSLFVPRSRAHEPRPGSPALSKRYRGAPVAFAMEGGTGAYSIRMELELEASTSESAGVDDIEVQVHCRKSHNFWMYYIDLRRGDVSVKVCHRYSQFADLHAMLGLDNPPLPALPPKRALQPQTSAFAQRRCSELQLYTLQLLRISGLQSSPELNCFLQLKAFELEHKITELQASLNDTVQALKQEQSDRIREKVKHRQVEKLMLTAYSKLEATNSALLANQIAGRTDRGRMSQVPPGAANS